MVEEDSITKIAFIGNTKLTLKAMMETNVSLGLKTVAVFGLSNGEQNEKTNFVRLDNYCLSHNIKLFETTNWQEFGSFCKKAGADLIITMGDSRIVPEEIISSFNVIGNHGAVLPHVQGGASLVWGRMLNSGEWGISIMEIDKKVDAGKILKIKKFKYDNNYSEYEFTEKCDDMTVEALIEVLSNDYNEMPNSKWDVRVAKYSDSFKAVNILEYCLKNNLNIYLPPRTIEDSKVKKEWPLKFIDIFKKANNDPYPKWTE